MLITVRVAVILGFAFVAAALMVADGNSWPKALFGAGAAFGAVLTVANTFIGPST